MTSPTSKTGSDLQGEFCPLDQHIEKLSSAEVDEQNAYHELVNYAPICIHEIGLDSCLKKMNRAGLDMMGLEIEDQVVDKPYTSFVGDDNQDWIQTLLQKAIEGEPIPNFDFSVGVGLEKRSFASNFIPMLNANGEVIKLMGVTRETTEETLAKEALLRLNNELQDRVTDATKDLQATLDHLKETQSQLIESEKNSSLGGLVAGIAHEVNTPLGISITATSHIVDETQIIASKLENEKLTLEELKEHIIETESGGRILATSLDRAAKLISSFKRMAIDQSSAIHQTFNVHNVITDTIMIFGPQINGQSITTNLTCGKDIEIFSEPGAFSQVITNLLQNSLTHGFDENEKGSIEISVIEQDNHISLTYCDSGKGIDSASLPKIYDPFFTTNRHNGSSGLGLNLVFNIINQALNGSIKCVSNVKEGVEFTITLPLHLPLNTESKQ